MADDQQTTPRVWTPDYLAADQSPVAIEERKLVPGKTVRHLLQAEQRIMASALRRSLKIVEE